jgi:hypothetical protein
MRPLTIGHFERQKPASRLMRILAKFIDATLSTASDETYDSAEKHQWRTRQQRKTASYKPEQNRPRRKWRTAMGTDRSRRKLETRRIGYLPRPARGMWCSNGSGQLFNIVPGQIFDPHAGGARQPERVN